MKRTTTTKEMAEYLRLNESGFVRRCLQSDYKDMPRDEIKGIRGTKEYRFNIEEVMNWIMKEFN